MTSFKSTCLASALLGVAFLAIGPSGASAAIVYDNGTPTTNNGYQLGGVVGGQGYTTADNFSIAAGAAGGGGGFYFQNYNGITGWDGKIDYAFHSDSAGAPGSVLASGAGNNVVATLSGYNWCCGGGNAWLVTFDLPSTFTASAGTSYWLELGGAGGPNPWWVTTGPGNAVYLSYGAVSSQYDHDVAFYLTSAVPEPDTLALFGLGLAGLAVARRFKR